MKKKILALFLAMLMLFATCIPAFATEQNTSVAQNPAFADGNSLIVFVTGIGQSWSYLFDESYLADGAFENGDLHDYENYAPLIANGKYSARWNLFNNNIGDNIKDPEAIKAALKILLHLFASVVTRTNTVKDEDVNTLVRLLFKYNLVDENGKCDERVVTPRYTMPLSEYPGVTDENGKFTSEAKTRFYNSIPCADICREKLGENYEDYIYCYNYCAFSYTSNNVEGLHEFIETIIADNKVGAKDVVLVPMSMGASVVSAYLAAYPQMADNHVRRVVSIVGCWQGSDVIYDLITKQYADNSAELFYNGIIGDLVGEPWGYLVNGLLRIFPKKGLRGLIDQALGSISDNIILSAPSLAALVPNDKYEEIRPLINNEKILAETDTYYQAQSTLQQRLADLEAQGMTFSFISGYGLPYGAITSDYKVFGFMKHAATTNSDEIININSTAPGTSFVPYNQQYSDEAGRILSPDKSIDISTAFYKDSCWYFYGQKHELEYNNTAIKLAIELALGNIKTVDDCNDPNGEKYFPQFNDGRNIKALVRDYIPAIDSYCKTNNYTLTADQQQIYDSAKQMLNRTVNDLEGDEKIIADTYNLCLDLGIYSPEETPGFLESFANSALKTANDVTFRIFGAKGYLDLPDSIC